MIRSALVVAALLLESAVAGPAQAQRGVANLDIVPQVGHSSAITAVAFSADESMLATGGTEIKLWDTATGILLRTFEPREPVRDLRFDAGLVIHEARFTYPRYGLRALVDLGQWWETQTGLPIPLGAILARRGAVDPTRAAEWVRASVRTAWADPTASRDYVLAHAQEMEPAVVDRHIGLYVNRFTEDLGPEGYAAVDALLGRASTAGLTPTVPVLSR